MNRIRKGFLSAASVTNIARIAGIAGLLLHLAGCSHPAPGTFDTPEEAVQALHDLIGSGDERRIEELFGPGSLELFRSGDAADDRRASQLVKEMIAEKVEIDELDEDTVVALLGKEAWPFTIPLVRCDGRWRFDTEAGREELLNRRIGYNELSTLATLHEFVAAQQEYAEIGRDGNPPAFAQRFRSSEGLRDGLYWDPVEGEPLSPIGDLLAEAQTSDPAPQPFHGYYYHVLTGQGPAAPGGERSYIDGKGLMTGGFAAIAWPAKYGNSGVMTFLVNRQDIVFQKDLGTETATLAAGIRLFDPDLSWTATGDRLKDEWPAGYLEGRDPEPGEQEAGGR